MTYANLELEFKHITNQDKDWPQTWICQDHGHDKVKCLFYSKEVCTVLEIYDKVWAEDLYVGLTEPVTAGSPWEMEGWRRIL